MKYSLLVAAANAQGFSNSFFATEKYIMGSAKSKLGYLWDEITRDSTPYGWFSSASLAQIFIESMEPSFSTKGDAMESGMLWNR